MSTAPFAQAFPGLFSWVEQQFSDASQMVIETASSVSAHFIEPVFTDISVTPTSKTKDMKVTLPIQLTFSHVILISTATIQPAVKNAGESDSSGQTNLCPVHIPAITFVLA